MSARPHVSPTEAGAILALCDAAKVHAPGCELAWIKGFCTARAADTYSPREQSEVELHKRLDEIDMFTRSLRGPGRYSRVGEDTTGTPIGRVELTKEEGQ